MYSTHIHNEFTYLLALEESPLFSLSNKSLRAIQRWQTQTTFDSNKNLRYVRPTSGLIAISFRPAFNPLPGTKLKRKRKREREREREGERAFTPIYTLVVSRLKLFCLPQSLSIEPTPLSPVLCSCDRRVHAHSIKSVYT